MTGSETSPPFRLAYVPGVTPAKWVRVWHERLPDVPLTLHAVPDAEAADLMRAGGADAGFVRLPVDRTFFSAIPLYTETTVVVVPKDHVITAADEVTLADLADETVLHPLDDVLDWAGPPGEAAFERPADTADAVELVAAGIGLLVVPQSLARLHHRKDLTYRTVVDAPQSSVGLSWPEEATTELVEDFIGIVRGRTVNSSRGRRQPEPQPKEKRADPAGRRKPAAPRAKPASGRGARGGGKGKPRRRS
ncbi:MULTISPECIES: LysR family transcriptional regulator substrate-binding protein [Streptomyces]|uniref:LysR family transcriptional regulator substrate-binding protein n=1 Tax=Streptomyces doudnae TaxID=3075536 RepID=A0ABD5F2D6_9ACTN|nr:MULTISPECIES: LysR family transcriptional regulator substrate-binding protein [unclassified Streptomyces]MDT0439882.1 LysR family transcriptional regulator substrate-binding protein [Streptomyces sp. DSM 41981]MYQ68915.1 LysR family transcriptional regulator [Streptomyces sp. SID4950]SCE49995.1 LysR substrate binding domain-containing protein [Streptomyces sp. SolWspMP-5a-2]